VNDMTTIQTNANANASPIAFIGGGNMASALIGGLLRAGRAPASVWVIEPFEAQRDKLQRDFGINAWPAADARLAGAGTVVWAVKPQLFGQAAAPCAAWVSLALQVSVMAGIRTTSIVAATGSPQVVRAMPNTPALIGKGISGLYARPGVDDAARAEVSKLFAPTGQSLWVDEEDQLDAVTALSGSGPAYVFYFLEAMVNAAVEMGLSADQGRALAIATFDGAAALAAASTQPLDVLRQQVTSKGGTTHAAVTAMQAAGIGPAIEQAVRAAQARAAELGREFGG